MGKEGGITCARPKWGNCYDDFRQAIIKVLAETTILDQSLQVLMSCANDPNVYRNLVTTAKSFDDPFLEEAQQFGLQGVRQVADFVQHQRPAVCAFDFADGGLGGAGKGAFFVTEQFAFE